MDAPGMLASAVFAGFTAAVAYKVNELVPEPYMDEIFHIPQVSKYCEGRFDEWDDKITTLPGLYLSTVGMLNPVQLCDASHVRWINVLFASLTVLVLHKIMTQIHGDKHYYDKKKVLLSAVSVGCFPLLYFFAFLYYTDVGSTFMVLLMYCLHLDKSDWFAAFIGALAVLFRQTNIVWVFFVAVQALLPIVAAHAHEARMMEKKAKFSLNAWGQTKEILEGTTYLAFHRPRLALRMLASATKTCAGYILVGLAFLAFVVKNEGVVVGDRSAHEAVIHPTQVLYFCAFCLLTSAPFCLSRLPAFVSACKRHWMGTLAVALLVGCVVRSFTLAHPYLLADNRHYTFYVWRRGIARLPLALIPLYLFGAYCILRTLRRTDLAFKLAFPFCILANLVPQHLLEFRYFVIPYLFYRLQVRPQSWWKLWTELAIFVAVNAATLGMFLYKPFRWEQEPHMWQRFMW